MFMYNLTSSSGTRIPNFSQTSIGKEGKEPHLESLVNYVADYIASEIVEADDFSEQNIEKALLPYQIACGTAATVVQNTMNSGGGLTFTNPIIRQLSGEKAERLFNILLGIKGSKCMAEPAQDLYILCKHRNTFIRNRKCSWFGTNFTNHTQQFLDVLANGELATLVSRKIAQIKQIRNNDINIIEDFFSIAAAVFSQGARSSLPRRGTINMNPEAAKVLIKDLLFDSALINQQEDFEEMLSSLAVPACNSESLSLIGIKLSDFDQQGNAVARLVDVLAKKKNITKLNLSGCEISAEDIRLISDKLPHLTALRLRDNLLNDNDISSLPQLHNLTLLDLSNNLLTAAGAKHLSELKNLQVLYINNNRLGSAGVSHLCKLKNLVELSILNNGIKPECVEQLITLPSLASLYVSGKELKADARQYLLVQRNDLKVHFDENVSQISWQIR
ncbi:MAG: leucine-rich repeat domain-containing protein [Burkholderiales bacterium]